MIDFNSIKPNDVILYESHSAGSHGELVSAQYEKPYDDGRGQLDYIIVRLADKRLVSGSERHLLHLRARDAIPIPLEVLTEELDDATVRQRLRSSPHFTLHRKMSSHNADLLISYVMTNLPVLKQNYPLN